MQIQLPLKHQQTFPANPVNIVPLREGAYLLNFASHVTKLRANLTVEWEKPLQGKVAANDRLMAIAGLTAIQLLDPTGEQVLHTIAHAAWDRYIGAACYFGRDHKTIWYILPGYELQVMHTDTFETIASLPLPESEQYTFHATPDDDIILLEASAGLLMQVQLKDGAISLTLLPQCDDRIMGNFAPSGKEFVMAPLYDGPLAFYSFPDMTMIAAMEQEDIFAHSEDFPAMEQDNINYSVFFVDDRTILLLSQFGRLLLVDRQDLRYKADMLPAGIVFTAHNLHGDPTTVRDEIYDYSSNIINVMLLHEQLLLTTSEGQLRSYAIQKKDDQC